MTEPDPVIQVRDRADAGRRRPRWTSRAAVVPVVAFALGGVVLGAARHLLTPLAAAWAESYEVQLAGDITLAVLQVLAGLVTAAVLLLRSGAGAATRFVLAVVCSAVGSLVAWGVGELLGTPPLSMPSLLLLWPLTLSTVTVAVTLVATLVLRDPYDDSPT